MSDDMELIEIVRTGAPIEFEIEGYTFAFRQPSPSEMDRLRQGQTRTYDRVFNEYRADGMADAPVTDGLTETISIYTDALETQYQAAMKAGDSEAARAAAEAMEDGMNWPKTLGAERANDAARRFVGRWIVDNLFTGDRAEFDRLTRPDPLERDEVGAATQRSLAVMNYDPNSTGRTQS